MKLQEVYNIYHERLWPYKDYKMPKLGTSEYANQLKDTEQHLLHLQACCKRCHKRDVLRDIWADLRYFIHIATLPDNPLRQKHFKIGPQVDRHEHSKQFIIAYSLYSIVIGPKTKDYYFQIRMNVYFMFIAMKKEHLFDWHWFPMDIAPKRKKGEDLIFVEGLFNHLVKQKLFTNEMTFYDTYSEKSGTLCDQGQWVSDLKIEKGGRCSYRVVAEPVGWHHLSNKRQQELAQRANPDA